MSITIKSKWVEPFLWLLSSSFLFWHVFISVIVMDVTGLIPMLLVGGVMNLLYVRHNYLSMGLQLWALYMLMSSGLKLLGSYMQSIGSISYDWSMASMYRNIIFILIALLLYYISWNKIEIVEEGQKPSE